MAWRSNSSYQPAPDWSELEKVNGELLERRRAWGGKEFSVNRAGIALIRVNNFGLDRIHFGTDLTNRATIEVRNG